MARYDTILVLFVCMTLSFGSGRRLEDSLPDDAAGYLASARTRRLQQSCSSCPSNAAAVCSGLTSSEQTDIRNTLVSSCGGTLSPSATSGSCCSAIPSAGSARTNYLACLCAGDTLAGLSAYVSTANVVQSCWCNQVTGGASSSSGDSPPVALSVESGTSPDAVLGAVPSPASDGAGSGGYGG
ncbi:hypothetical protein ACKKBF_B01660 [Auxenochlorella protothecoides x Auxenochlorella symbiontica]